MSATPLAGDYQTYLFSLYLFDFLDVQLPSHTQYSWIWTHHPQLQLPLLPSRLLLMARLSIQPFRQQLPWGSSSKLFQPQTYLITAYSVFQESSAHTFIPTHWHECRGLRVIDPCCILQLKGCLSTVQILYINIYFEIMPSITWSGMITLKEIKMSRDRSLTLSVVVSVPGPSRISLARVFFESYHLLPCLQCFRKLK